MLLTGSHLAPTPFADRECGFTLAETLAALLILSLATALLGQFVTLTLKSEYRTKAAINAARETGTALRQSCSLIDANGNTISIQSTQASLDAACLYDVLGRRCR